jgi:hypothetical protein
VPTVSDADEAREGGANSVLGKARVILESFELDDDSLTLTEIAVRTGISKATVHRLNQELLEWGMLERIGLEYRLGMRAFELAAGCRGSACCAMPCVRTFGPSGMLLASSLTTPVVRADLASQAALLRTVSQKVATSHAISSPSLDLAAEGSASLEASLALVEEGLDALGGIGQLEVAHDVLLLDQYRRVDRQAPPAVDHGLDQPDRGRRTRREPLGLSRDDGIEVVIRDDVDEAVAQRLVRAEAGGVDDEPLRPVRAD